ncbi:unnamed protein product [Musa acuminata var. zebrina]
MSGPVKFHPLDHQQERRKRQRRATRSGSASWGAGDRPQARQCLRARPLVAVGSRSLDNARRFIALASYEAVLDDPCVAVYVPLPTNVHVRWVVGAAERGKHMLLEKPTALCASDLDRILDACRSRGRPRCRRCCPIRPHAIVAHSDNGLHFVSHITWKIFPEELHGRRLMITQIILIRRISSLFDSAICCLAILQRLECVLQLCGYAGDSDFLENDICVMPELDALGALGDVGWYCSRSILWVADYELPKKAVAIHGAVKTKARLQPSSAHS